MRSLSRKLRPVKLRLSFFYWIAGVVLFIALSLWVSHWWGWQALQQQPIDETKKKQFDASLDVVKAVVGGVGTIATIGGGVVLYLNFRVANRNAEIANRNAEIAQKKLEQETEKARADAKLAESRLLMERFSKAVDMMGNDKSIHLRLGGIYALEGIARDSSDDKVDDNYRQVLEVLTAFVRENSPYPPRKQVDKEETIPLPPTEAPLVAFEGQAEEIPPLPTDIQAALTVLNRRKHKDGAEPPLDLRKTDLRRANLNQANLQRTNLHAATFRGAALIEANLEEARLIEANLQEARLIEANLQQAYLYKANLQEADIEKAKLQQAYLVKAKLQQANLSMANLQQAKLSMANLQGARLHGADLTEANLQQADLKEANLQWADFRKANLQEADLYQANLQQANLFAVDLQQANLQGTDLSGAVLLATDLRHAENFDPTQLEGEQPPLLCNVALPEGFSDKDKLKDRDCDRLPHELLKRYPREFERLEAAQQFVDEQRQKKWE